MIRSSVVAVLLSTLGAGSAHAGVIDLATQMGNANIFTLGDFKSQNSDVEGAIVSGGSVDIQGYAVNANNADAFDKDGYALVARNDVKLSNGQINNGKVYAGGAVSLNSANNPVISTTRPIDFDVAAAYFTALSTDLSKVTATGNASQAPWGAVTLAGGGSGVLDVFNINGDMFKSSNDWRMSGLTAGQTLILNVSGSLAGANPNGVSFNPFSGYNVLYNFYEATNLDLRGMLGGVLAPKAAVTVTWGDVRGNVVVGSWNSNVQVNLGNSFTAVDLAGFRDPLPPFEPPVKPPVDPVDPVDPPLTGEVPEPGSFGLMLAAVAVAAVTRKRRRA